MLLEGVLNNVSPGLISHIGLILLVYSYYPEIFWASIFFFRSKYYCLHNAHSRINNWIYGLNGVDAAGIAPAEFWRQISNTNGSVFSLTLLALWSFAGLEYSMPVHRRNKTAGEKYSEAMLAGLRNVLFCLRPYSFCRLETNTWQAILAASEFRTGC